MYKYKYKAKYKYRYRYKCRYRYRDEYKYMYMYKYTLYRYHGTRKRDHHRIAIMIYNNETWTSSNPRISASPFYALIQKAQIQIQERRSQKPLEIGRFGPPPQKEGRSELGSEPLKLVRRFFFFFFFFLFFSKLYF